MMNVQEMYDTSVLFRTQEFPKTNITCSKSYFYGIKSPLCFNALSDHHRFFFFSKCDIIKDSFAAMLSS